MKKIVFILALVTFCFNAAALDASSTSTPPKLIVQIVVDQLRGDLLYQYKDNFSPDGFNYLLTHSINYQNAHHPHALTVTCVGHATIATGSTPSLHGIIANDWYDPLTKQVIYCTEDPQSPLLPSPRSQGHGKGQSPRNLMASTLSDELVLAERGRAFGVSLKDRSAITLAGHAGKAFWFDKEQGGFITSKYYYTKYPSWVNNWNQGFHPKNAKWELMSPIATYRYAKVPPIHAHFAGFNETFPHELGSPDSPTYYKYLAMSPFADAITANFAINLLRAEQLGKTANKTDYLAVSFSVVDVIGHQFGPNSLESEDNLRHLDRTIAQFIKAIDAEVGLQNTLIVLTADHGMVDSPSWLAQNHMQGLPALNIEHLTQSIHSILSTQFKLPPEALEMVKPPYIYLNHALLTEKRLPITGVSNYLAMTLRQEPGLFTVYALPLLQNDQDWISKKVTKMSFPNRSGDLYIVPKPYQNISDIPEMAIAHGSPWNYDSYIPLLFVNPAFKPQVITRLVHSTDIAATLAELLFIKAPSASVGAPLKEVIKQSRKKTIAMRAYS